MSDANAPLDYRSIIKLRVLQDDLYRMLNRVKHLNEDLAAFGIPPTGAEIFENEIDIILENIHSKMETALKEPSVWEKK